MSADKNKNLITDSISTTGPKLNPEIKTQLSQISSAVNEANKLVNINVKDLDAKQVDKTISKVRPAQHVYNQLKHALSDFKRQMNHYRDHEMKRATDLLNSYNFQELAQVYPKLKVLKQQIWNLRSDQRWNQLKKPFQDALKNYPTITKHAEYLTDFGNFRALYPKLISSAKNKHVNNKTIAKMNHIINQWNTDLTTIASNPIKLNTQSQKHLIHEYVQDPKQFGNNQMLPIMMNQKKLEQQQSQEKQNKAKSLQQAKQQNKKLKQLLKTKQQKNKSNNEQYTWLNDYLKQHEILDQIKQSRTKAGILFHMFNGKNGLLMDKHSVFYQHTHLRATKVIDLVQHILNM